MQRLPSVQASFAQEGVVHALRLRMPPHGHAQWLDRNRNDALVATATSSPRRDSWAFLTRVLRVYLDYLPTSVLGFVCKHIEEGRPPYIVNCFGKDSRRQTFAVEVFDEWSKS